jgi:hypothetical protein
MLLCADGLKNSGKEKQQEYPKNQMFSGNYTIHKLIVQTEAECTFHQ